VILFTLLKLGYLDKGIREDGEEVFLCILPRSVNQVYEITSNCTDTFCRCCLC